MLTSTLNENKLSSAANSIYKNKANSTYNTYIQATPSMPTPKNTKVHGFQQSSATTFATIRASSVYAIVATPLKKENPSQERKPLPKCLKKNKGVWNVLNSYGQELSCIDLGNPQKSPVTKKNKKKNKKLGGFYQGDAPSGAVRNGIPAVQRGITRGSRFPIHNPLGCKQHPKWKMLG